jgi:hypothetical protein
MCGTHLRTVEHECPVCYEKKTLSSRKMSTLSCGHKLCKSCLAKWNEHNTTCPMCRADVLPKKGTLFYINIMDEMDRLLQLEHDLSLAYNASVTLELDSSNRIIGLNIR